MIRRFTEPPNQQGSGGAVGRIPVESILAVDRGRQVRMRRAVLWFAAGLLYWVLGGPVRAADAPVTATEIRDSSELAGRTTRAPADAPVAPINIRDLDPQEAMQVGYARQIRPLLSHHCADCHSADERKSEFEITSVATLLKGGKKAGAAVVPGKPDASPLVQYVRGLRQPQMPKGEEPLSEAQVHLIRLWILGGARDDSSPALAGAVTPREEDAQGRKSQAANLPMEAEAAYVKEPLYQATLNALLFSENNERLMALRQRLRLARLPAPPAPPQVDVPTFNPIDQFIAAKWKAAGLDAARHPPPLCDDAAFQRRVYLDVIGVIPTVAEAQKFQADPAPDKRLKLVDALLARQEDYAAHWTPFWEDALGSATTDSQGGIPTRGNYRQWIYTSFLNNRPFDILVAELIDPTMPGHKKAGQINANGKISTVAYVRNDTPTDTIQSAANTAQVFLGTSMKCAGCHNHFLNKEWPQTRFLGFAGLFAEKDLEVIRCEKKTGRVVPARFPFDLPEAPPEAPSDLESRLHRLALLLTDPTNPRFAKTIVNRLWKRYLGLGLFEPADDFRLDQPPSQPELLAWLADDFMRRGYDLKQTIRLILNSRTYQLRFDPQLADHFDLAKPDAPRYYRSPALRRLTAEQFIDSVRMAATQTLAPQSRAYLDKSSTALTRALGKPASRNEISTSRPDDVAVVQALELLNGQEFHALVYSEKSLAALAAESDSAQTVTRLYWMAFSRPPTSAELDLGNDFLESGGGQSPAPSRIDLVGDLLWALFTSPNFQFIR